VVTSYLLEKQLYDVIWQFPVVLVPYSDGKGETIILRPVRSLDAMTATAYPFAEQDLKELAGRIKTATQVAWVLYDLTSKPPGTIEWE
jgi:GMP synthase (glutamine-hydrolysing)